MTREYQIQLIEGKDICNFESVDIILINIIKLKEKQGTHPCAVSIELELAHSIESLQAHPANPFDAHSVHNELGLEVHL